MTAIDAKVHGNIVVTSAADQLTFTIGKFMVNCGLLEFETYMWIHGFGSADPSNIERAREEQFGARKRRLLRIMDGLPIAPEMKVGIREVWSEADAIMKFRNVIAHSPVLAQYHGPDAEPEWFIRVIDAKTMGSRNLREHTESEIREWNERAHDLSKRIVTFRESVSGGTIKVKYEP